MRRLLPIDFFQYLCIILFLLFGFDANAQVTQVEIQGGLPVDPAIPVSITTGSSLTFRVTNGETNNCRNLRVSDINLSGATGGTFSISPSNLSDNIKPASCNGDHDLLFSVSRTDSGCSIASVTVTLLTNDGNFVFTFEVTRSPEIYMLGGSPYSDILHGDITTSDTNGTFFGVVSEGDVVIRYYVVANIGSCNLDVNSLSSSNPDYIVFAPYGIPVTLPSYYYTVIGVKFTAPSSPPLPDPKISGTQRSTISVFNSDNTEFNFDVTAEMFDFTGPQPGGITADFRLWLKGTRGVFTGTSGSYVAANSADKVSQWEDIGTNSKDATQSVSTNQPTYLDTATDNINFNPVIKFENGVSIEQYLENDTNGFYSQDMFVVMVPDTTMDKTSSPNTIFGGIDSGNPGDMTGIGFGDYSTRFTDETLSYNQNIPTGPYNGYAETNSSYSKAGIINVTNNTDTSPTYQDILYNSNPLSILKIDDVPFNNVGASGLGSRYWIGRNMDVQGSLNGRIAEIFTFASKLTVPDRQKVESYLAIKYGITLGPSNKATKDYINSFGKKVWDISADFGLFNYDVAGIGRDSISDLNQKQSKTINHPNGVTIGLGGLFATNSANPNEFENDGDFLVWGHDDGAFSGASPNTVTIASGITTSLTRIDRKWKIVENTEVEGSDVENVFVGIPTIVLSSLSKTANEEYVLIVADNANFYDGDIIDVIPLKINIDINGSPILDQNGNQVYKAWYDFNETKYFTFGIAAKFTGNHSLNIASGDFLVGEYELNLNVDSFTISAWIKSASNPSTRTIMAKGEKLQLRLNSLNQIEVMIEDDITPKYTSTMTIGDGKWHQLTFVYNSGSIFLYVDGVLDKSVQNVVHPSPNYNHFSIGAIYKNHSPVNSFIGQIDEVYVWDIALSEDQIRYLMNQEIERFDNSGTDYVSGKTLPQMAANNPISAIPWRRLRAYYDFNSFYGSTVAGLTDNRFFLRLQYLKKDKTVIVDQTIPAPYVSAADGDWDDPATWSNSSDQMIPNTLGLDGTTIVDWNIVETTHNITSGDRDIKVLALKNDSGTITIAKPLPELQDETNSGQGLTITNYLELDGVIDLVGESQLVQTEGSILDEDSGGYIIRHQQGTANGFNYNYWSSSVGPVGIDTGSPTGISSTNADYTIKDVLKDGTNAASYPYPDITFNPSYSAADSSSPNWPRTISSYWMYKFYGPASDYYSWEKIDENTPLGAGEGFTMKGTSGASALTNQQNYAFVGKPNNGDFTLALNKLPGDVNRLIGNPYPSAMDATEFILDNMSVADGGNNPTGNVINGAVYFWDHYGQTDSHYLGDYVGGYATYNLTGGTPAITQNWASYAKSSAPPIPPFGETPGQYIPVNQGFFVSTGIDGFQDGNGVPLVSVAGGDIVFKNSQRAFVTETSLNSIFLKSNKAKAATNAGNVNNVPLIRLMYDSPEGYQRQLAIGSVKEASNGFDMGYDAFMADVNMEDMYWTIGTSKFVIQGVRDFNVNQEFPLGLIVKNGGLAKIRIDKLENIDPSLEIFIKDTMTGETVLINQGSFQINLAAGIYDDRFKLVFQAAQNNQLSVVENDLDDKILIYYDTESSNLHIDLMVDAEVSGGMIFNFLGQKISAIDKFSKSIVVPCHVSTGAYIIQLNTAKGVVNKKIIID